MYPNWDDLSEAGGSRLRQLLSHLPVALAEFWGKSRAGGPQNTEFFWCTDCRCFKGKKRSLLIEFTAIFLGGTQFHISGFIYILRDEHVIR